MSAHDSKLASTLGLHQDSEADVLVIGGGPAGTWAAWSAATQGAKVILADKGYCGTSGATAAAGTTVWYISNPANRETELSRRETLGGFLSDRDWMNRVLDRARVNLNRLVEWGYPFSRDDNGHPYLPSLHQGVEYMRLMRKQVKIDGATLGPSSRTFEPTDIIRAVQAEVIPYDRNLFRTEKGLSESLNRLHELWSEIRNASVKSEQQTIQAREAAAMVATARWMYATALERRESRGMHKHEDYSQTDAKQQHRLLSGGLDRVWVKPEQDIAYQIGQESIVCQS